MLKLGMSVKLVKEVKATVEKLQPRALQSPPLHFPNVTPFKSSTLPASPPWPQSKTATSVSDSKEKFQSWPPMSPPPETAPTSLSPMLTPPAWVSPPSVSPPWSSTPSPVSSSTSSPASSGKERSVVQRKSTSLGALGQALHGEQLGLEPREDSRANAVQICPICRFQAATKNPYRNLQVSLLCFTEKLMKQTENLETNKQNIHHCRITLSGCISWGGSSRIFLQRNRELPSLLGPP